MTKEEKKLKEARDDVLNAKTIAEYRSALARLAGMSSRGEKKKIAGRLGGLASGKARRRRKLKN